MNQNPGIVGIKVGVTQVFLDDGNLVAGTVIRTNCKVVGKRLPERDGYSALILGLGEAKDKHISKAVKVSFEKNGQKAPKIVREIRLGAEAVAAYELGTELKVADIFKEGQRVDVQGETKGHGFSGVIVRHNFAGSKNSHGARHESRRHGGSIGMATTPGRVWPGTKMAGQHGNKTHSVLNQMVVKVLAEENAIVIRGSVPGGKNGVIRVQGAVKKRNGGMPADK